MKHRLPDSHSHNEPWYEPESDPYAVPIRSGVAVRITSSRKRPQWDVVRIAIETDPADVARARDEIVDVSPFTVQSELGPVLLSRRPVAPREIQRGAPLEGGRWPGLVDSPEELAVAQREARPVVFDSDNFWNLFSHLDGRPQFAGLESSREMDRTSIPPGMQLNAAGVAGLESILRTLEPAHVRAFHEGLAYQLYLADRPEHSGQSVPPRVADLREDPTVLRRIGLIAAGPEEVRSVRWADVALSEEEEQAALSILDISGKVLGEGSSANWSTVFDPFTGANPAWGHGRIAPSDDSFGAVVYDSRPWGPFRANPSFLLFDGKTAYGVRLFVPVEGGHDELIFLVRENTRRRAAQQVLDFLPAWVGSGNQDGVLVAEIYSSTWHFVLDSFVAFARSLRDPDESADGFDIP